VVALTGAAGLMIGRGVIRNPWLFRQVREQRSGSPIFRPTGRDVFEYIHGLYETVSTPGIRESAQINNMKKYLNFIGLGVEPTGEFLHRIRRATTRGELFAICAAFLDHDDAMPLEPFPISLKPTDVMAGATR
jgi:tRNA-dihydrouridine synthase